MNLFVVNQFEVLKITLRNKDMKQVINVNQSLNYFTTAVTYK